jgi:hypothetical protein
LIRVLPVTEFIVIRSLGAHFSPEFRSFVAPASHRRFFEFAACQQKNAGVPPAPPTHGHVVVSSFLKNPPESSLPCKFRRAKIRGDAEAMFRPI